MRVAVVLPSSPIRDGAERAAFEAGLAWLEARGHTVVLPAHDVSRAGELPWLAGDDDTRAAELAVASHADVDVVWMGRGGSGALRTLAALDARGARADMLGPVPLWGFSDGTALLAAWAHAGRVCWSAPPIVQLARLDAASCARVEAALAGDEVAPFEGLAPVAPVVSGVAEGPLAGGNLAVLASLVGTAWMPRLAGAIVVLEDVGEVGYRVDRMLHQLSFAGAFEGVAGVVLGAFTGVAEREVDDVARSLAVFFARRGVPCARGLPFGHGATNVPLPMQRVARLDVAAGTLTIAPAGAPAIVRVRAEVA